MTKITDEKLREHSDAIARRFVEALYVPAENLDPGTFMHRHDGRLKDPRILRNAVLCGDEADAETKAKWEYCLHYSIIATIKEFQKFWSKVGTRNEGRLFWENEAPDAWMDE